MNMNMKFQLFALINRLLPQHFKVLLGESTILRPLRNAYFRPSGLPACEGGIIEFEQLRFFFSAPYQMFIRAKEHGIENTICRLILSNVPRGGVCIDVGANFGFLTLIMSLAVGAEGQVISFEPIPFIYRALQTNVKANQLEAICHLHQAAVGCHPQQAVQTTYLNQTYAPTVTDLDGIVSKHQLSRLDLVKIDVDGGDWDVLLGAQHTLRKFRPLLIVEMTTNHEKIFQTLVELGYTHILDMKGQPITASLWPPNLFAAMHPISIPARGMVFQA